VAPVDHAKAYPFHIPARSYVLHGDGHRELLEGEPMPDLAGRFPVIACGSNQSPEQLGRKFSDKSRGPIPVLKVTVKDFDAVYSPHFSNYGSVPATLHHTPGTHVELFANWLTEEELTRMHETEAVGMNYDFGRLDGIHMETEGGDTLHWAYAYIGRRGSLTHQGEPLALAEVPATARRWTAMTQTDVLHMTRDRLQPESHIDIFIREHIDSPDVRLARTEKLARGSLPFAFGGFSVIAV